MRDLEKQRLAIQVLSSGCVRTRRDAEFLRERIEENGWQQDLLPVYRTILYLLGDRSAFAGLNRKQEALARMCLERAKKWWIGDSDCRCLRGPDGRIVQRLSSCPVHSPDTCDRIYVPGVGFLG